MTFIYDERVEPHFGGYYSAMLALAYFKHQRAHVMDRGFTSLSAVDSRHRGGKSLFASTVGYMLDPSFWPNYEERVVTEASEFMTAIESIAAKGIKGGVIQVDEGGVMASSSDWYEKFARVLVKTFNMFGVYRPVVYFCQPVRSSVLSSLRKLFHNYYRIERYSTQFNYVFPYTLKFSSMMNKWFQHHPTVRLAGEKVTLTRIKFFMPPKFIIDRYEAHANVKKDSMLERFVDEIRTTEFKAQKDTPDVDKLVTLVCDNYKQYETKQSKPNNVKLEQAKIEFTLKVNSRIAKYIKFEAERKAADRNKAAIEEEEKKKFNVSGRQIDRVNYLQE